MAMEETRDSGSPLRLICDRQASNPKSCWQDKMDGEGVWKTIHKEVLPHASKTEGEKSAEPSKP